MTTLTDFRKTVETRVDPRLVYETQRGTFSGKNGM